MKKVLVVGASHSDIPIILSAKSFGYYVITTGNNIDDIGHKYADEVCLADYSDRYAILELAKKYNIDVICSAANDFSLISSSFVAEKLHLQGYDSYETTVLLHHKDRFRKYAKSIGLKIPNASVCKNLPELENILKKFTLPVMIKAVDLTGGKGIKKVFSLDEAKEAARSALQKSKQNSFLVEEFIDGTLHSFSSFIENKKIVFLYIDNEFSYKNPYLVSTSTAPFIADLNIKNLLVQQCEKLASSLNLVDGLLHMQFLYTGSDIKILEFTRRMPGDFYAIPVDLATDVGYADQIFKYYNNQKPQFLYQTQSGYYSRHCVMATTNGMIKSIIFKDKIKKSIFKVFELKKIGDKIENFLIDKCSIVFLKYDSFEEMQRLNAEINQLIVVKL